MTETVTSSNDNDQRLLLRIDQEVRAFDVELEIAPTNCGNFAGAITGSIDLGSIEKPRMVSHQNVMDLLVDMVTVLDEAAQPNGHVKRDRYVFLPSWVMALVKKECVGWVSQDCKAFHIEGLERWTVYLCDFLKQTSFGSPWPSDNVWHCVFGQCNAVVFNSGSYRVVRPRALGEAVIKRYQ